ncbi:MAG: hypothetical protein DRJ03_08130 [Chloroflexi bacterium]|nr:MAG: hypothetical protein DRJ03_08130 [Chloroflexota bacterium]
MKCKSCVWFNKKYQICTRGWAGKSEKCPFYTPVPGAENVDKSVLQAKWKRLTHVVEWVANNASVLKCVGCSMPLSAAGWVLRWYPHPDGLKLEDFDEPMWVYVECCKCGYGNALWKLVKQLEAGR